MIDENLVENAASLGTNLKEKLSALLNDEGLTEEVADIRGEGLMLAIELNVPCGEMRKQLLFEHKIFTGASSNKNVLRILPPLSITEDDLVFFAEKFVDVLSKSLVK